MRSDNEIAVERVSHEIYEAAPWARLMELLPDGWDCEGSPEAAIAADLAELPRVQERRNQLEVERERLIDALREHHTPPPVDGVWQMTPALGETGCSICLAVAQAGNPTT